MAPISRLCILNFIVLTLLKTSLGSADETTPTVYQVLQEYGFPVGILPEGVTSYELDRSTGEFAVHLNETCSFTIAGYNLRYKTNVTGVISDRDIKNLSGVQVKVLFLWLNIGEVSVEGDKLNFSVGIVSADFPVDSFYESPQCGCGFDCVNAIEDNKFDWKRLVNSY